VTAMKGNSNTMDMTDRTSDTNVHKDKPDEQDCAYPGHPVLFLLPFVPFIPFILFVLVGGITRGRSGLMSAAAQNFLR
jgi:hypothetical protein